MRGPTTALLLALIGLAGCGGRSPSSSSLPLGRALSAAPASTSQAPAPIGDPLPERDGTIPKGQAAKENTPATGSIAPSPQAALRRYALGYTNWQATSLPAHERQIASLAVGAARLAAEQTAASKSTAAQLASNHVENKGVVLAIAPGEGPARGQWIVVTQEQTTGTGPYAGLPPTLHVTLARTERLNQGWAVTEWTARD
jgi:hypothetical protein